MKELMMGVLTKLFNKTEDELGELMFDGEEVKEGALDALVGLDAERISRVKKEAAGDSSKKFEDGYSKAKKEVMSRFEADFKEKTGFDSDLNGVDLVMKWSEGLGEGTEITAENIKSHPEFIKIENQWNEDKRAAIGEIQGEFETFKSGIEREKVMGEIRSQAKSEFLKLNPVLSADPSRAEAQTSLFLQKFDAYNYDRQDDGSVVIMDGDKRLEDAHGNRVQFSTFVKGEAEKVFDFQVQGQKQSPGNTPAGGSGGKITLSKDEYNIKVRETNGDPDAMRELNDTYQRAE